MIQNVDGLSDIEIKELRRKPEVDITSIKYL